MSRTEDRPWDETDRGGTELAVIRLELANLADKRGGGGLTREERRRHRELVRREAKLVES
jgi:hypothetical protein